MTSKALARFFPRALASMPWSIRSWANWGEQTDSLYQQSRCNALKPLLFTVSWMLMPWSSKYSATCNSLLEFPSEHRQWRALRPSSALARTLVPLTARHLISSSNLSEVWFWQSQWMPLHPSASVALTLTWSLVTSCRNRDSWAELSADCLHKFSNSFSAFIKIIDHVKVCYKSSMCNND